MHIHLPHVPQRTRPEVLATVEVALVGALLVGALVGLATAAAARSGGMPGDTAPVPVPQPAPVAVLR
ncbi:hypothetical protein QDR37_12690 [Amnibacterium sp. CER49]|uniref:hypothetical protein n=1 Tax=Amnibacterium sp. CER49 TaxID=3039161 RepID=UPI0024486EDB|nr:hypothetical protein [Amnibacterium sp. CER49]MDH2444805.1 hypothetical protein [Amnibacterium sp. CER49]